MPTCPSLMSRQSVVTHVQTSMHLVPSLSRDPADPHITVRLGAKLDTHPSLPLVMLFQLGRIISLTTSQSLHLVMLTTTMFTRAGSKFLHVFVNYH